jgi:hypothetical protein
MVLASCTANHELGRPGSQSGQERKRLGLIRPSADGTHFVHVDSGERFTVWGVNYDHDPDGRLLEDYWHAGVGHRGGGFRGDGRLGANAVRIHLQLGKFMKSPEQPNPAELEQRGRLLELAKRTGLYLNLTGLACYHKQDVPPWYDAMSEADRWAVQARFWEAVAKTCAGHPAMFCYDLMNEPILPGDDKKETDWLAGEFGGKYFVQRITLDLAGRSRHEVARAWIDTLVAAIRKHDPHTMITVGVIPGPCLAAGQAALLRTGGRRQPRFRLRALLSQVRPGRQGPGPHWRSTVSASRCRRGDVCARVRHRGA